MRKALLLVVLLVAITSIQAQNKRELQEEIATLKQELAKKDSTINSAKQQERISTARAEAFENQVSELQDANATLLQNLKVFTEASSRKSDNISRTLESLREKEAQLKVINDELGKNDSIALLLITDLKRALGESAQMKVAQGAIVLPISQAFMVGEEESDTTLTVEAQDYLSKVSQAIKLHPSWQLGLLSQENGIIEAKERTIQINNILAILSEETGIDAKAISQKKRDGLLNAFEIRVNPDYTGFYLTVRKNMKN